MQSARLWLAMLAVAVAGEALAQNQSLQRRQPALSKPALAPSVRPARPAAAPVRAAVPPSSTQQHNFEIQVRTSNLSNAESVRSQSEKRLENKPDSGIVRSWGGDSGSAPPTPSPTPSNPPSTPPLTPLDGLPSTQQESQNFQTLSNIMKSKHDSAKNAIQNLK